MKISGDSSSEGLIQQVLKVMSEKDLDPKQLSLRSGMPEQRLNEYLSGGRKFGVKTIKKIAKGLDVHVENLLNVQDQMDPRPSKFDMVDIFLTALDQYQRKSSSLAKLSANDYRHLMNLVECLGGWRKAIVILERELFEAPRREKRYQEELSEIFLEAHGYARHRRALAKKARGTS